MRGLTSSSTAIRGLTVLQLDNRISNLSLSRSSKNKTYSNPSDCKYVLSVSVCTEGPDYCGLSHCSILTESNLLPIINPNLNSYFVKHLYCLTIDESKNIDKSLTNNSQ